MRTAAIGYVAIALVAGTAPALATGAHTWRLVTLRTSPDNAEGDAVFYDAATVVIKSDKHVEYWERTVTAKELERLTQVLAENMKDDSFAKSYGRSAFERSVARGKPPIATISSLPEKMILAMVGIEDMVNEQAVTPKSQVLWELDCTGRLVRALEIVVTIDGQTKTGPFDREWSHIVPDSHAETMAALLCPNPSRAAK
jgi:hypothetical protein